jgi:hypothetical protein
MHKLEDRMSVRTPEVEVVSRDTDIVLVARDFGTLNEGIDITDPGNPEFITIKGIEVEQIRILSEMLSAVYDKVKELGWVDEED